MFRNELLSSATGQEPDLARLIHHKQRIMEELLRYPFHEPWWLKGGHLQTTYSTLFRRLSVPGAHRERWETPDGDFLTLGMLDGSVKKPMLVVLHGLEGSAESNYVLGLMRLFGQLDWGVAAIEFRSCGREMNRARRLYHSGETTDLEFVVSRLRERWPGRRMYLAGFSLGGNVAGKWLGENGNELPEEVSGAAIVCPPFDPTVSGPNIDRVFGGFYTRRFLKTLIPKAIEKERQYPGCMDIEAVKRSRTFEEFDTHATAALHGFRDCWDYWSQVGCGRFLEGIRRPTLLIAAEDDPFNPPSTLPRETAERSPYLYPQFTPKGGHVGFTYGPSPGRTRHWAEEQILRFCLACESA